MSTSASARIIYKAFFGKQIFFLFSWLNLRIDIYMFSLSSTAKNYEEKTVQQQNEIETGVFYMVHKRYQEVNG